LSLPEDWIILDDLRDLPRTMAKGLLAKVNRGNDSPMAV